MNAVFYSIALGGSEDAPQQLARSLHSLRGFDADMPVFVFVFGTPPAGFIEALHHLKAQVRNLGEYSAYVARKQASMSELFALDPKIHRWLVLEEPELKDCSRLLYLDSDTMFLGPASSLFDKYHGADLYAREEPFSRRSALGHNPAYLDEKQIVDMCLGESLNIVPPFNTGVCLITRSMADAITSVLPIYFDNLYRFLSWFNLNPEARSAASSSTRAVHDTRFKPDVERARPYPSSNRWIVDQIAMWLALGNIPGVMFADLSQSDVWQGAEFIQMKPSAPLPVLCHYFSSNMIRFMDWRSHLPPHRLTRS